MTDEKKEGTVTPQIPRHLRIHEGGEGGDVKQPLGCLCDVRCEDNEDR